MTASAAVDQVRLGDHVCWAYDDEAAGLDAADAFAATGLRLGQKVICYTGTTAPAAMRERLDRAGVPTEEALASGRLRILPAVESYLAGGPFRAGDVRAAFAAEIDRAREERYPGLRIAADMGWAVRVGVGLRELSRYEADVNRLFLDRRATGLCLYDRRLFPPGQLRTIGAAHPSTGGPHLGRGWRPALRAYRTDEPPGLRLVGQVDQSNRLAVRAVLAELAGRPAVLDLSELTFADVDTAHVLAGLGDDGVRLVGCRPRLRRLLDLARATGPGHPGQVSA
ncbi:MEDS domain-containing protein [Micromonospora sp. PLK6-60]|uniref:MEDS domain-containing protein n=1 Tax=Micromonospora sp. PLK6-60 TaxID=2873383 RepID=UPI001CA702BB|nr:MEDS domain-containing protein [Micromonospora sp. PLK6-60]MBY8874944.1 MEDS domain-containing protein [Micromonospora sp. PLK6-60]